MKDDLKYMHHWIAIVWHLSHQLTKARVNVTDEDIIIDLTLGTFV